VTLVPHDYAADLIVVDSGLPKEIPPGLYDVRAGAPELALGTPSTLEISEDDRAPAKVIRLSLIAGGQIHLDRAFAPPGGAVQVFSVATGRLDTMFVDRDRDLPFPIGQVIATSLAGPDIFLGVADPFGLSVGETKHLQQVHRPAPRSNDLIMKLSYVGEAERPQEFDVKLSLSRSGKNLDARVTSNIRDHYSVFYDVPWDSYAIQADSHFWWMTSRKIDIEATTGLLHDELSASRKPSLTLDPKPAGYDQPFAYTLYECDQAMFGAFTGAVPDVKKCQALREGTFVGHATLKVLDPRWYFVRIRRGKVDLYRQVDLSDGADRTLSPETGGVQISGHVLVGGHGQAAEISIEADDTREFVESTTSGSDGAYQVELPEQQIFRAVVSVGEMTGENSAVFRFETAGPAMTKDFEIPKAKALVVVSDSASQAPLAGALVVFNQAEGSEERKTDEKGEAELPPLPAGTMKLIVSADGYKRESVSCELKDQDTPQRIAVSLNPQRRHIRIKLSSGAAPERAMAFLLGYGMGVLEKVFCDPTGSCGFAEDPPEDGLLLAAGVGGGLTIVPAVGAFESGELALRPDGGVLRVAVARGSKTARSLLYLAVELDGLLVPEPVIASVANLLLKSYRIYLQPDNPQTLDVPGLPVGDVTVTVVPLEGPQQQPGQQTTRRVSLPQVSPVGVTVP
jgi:hypothetical protein